MSDIRHLLIPARRLLTLLAGFSAGAAGALAAQDPPVRTEVIEPIRSASFDHDGEAKERRQGGNPRQVAGYLAFDGSMDGNRQVDPQIAVGGGYVLHGTNGGLIVYTKEGEFVQGVSQSAFNGGIDPKLFFDPHRRVFGFDLWNPWDDAGLKPVNISVSETDDPTGAWNTYPVPAPKGVDGGGIGHSKQWIGYSFPGGPERSFVLKMDEVIAGQPATVYHFEGSLGHPVHSLDDVDELYFFEIQKGDFVVRRVAAGEDGAPVAELVGRTPHGLEHVGWPPQSPQKGTEVKTASGDRYPKVLYLQGGYLWFSQTVNVDGRAAVQWHQLELDGAIVQTGLISHPTNSYIQTTLAVNEQLDVLVGFQETGPEMYISPRLAWRRSGDPPGEVREIVALGEGQGATDGASWGDYSGSVCDGDDGLDLWTIQSVTDEGGKGDTVIVRVPFEKAGAEYHVSPRGDDAADGAAASPLRTLSEAARRARPGDLVTVHEGVYRERVDPPRGGTGDDRRIVYRAAPGEEAVIKGSERVRGWERVENDAWRLSLPDAYFGGFNPFKDEIRGDWFQRTDRTLHTGAVYLDGHWLTEAASLEQVLAPAGAEPLWFTPSPPRAGYLMNLAWFRPVSAAGEGAQVPAAGFREQRGVQVAPCAEGGECVGWIEDGDWTRFDGVDLGAGTAGLELRLASATAGGRVEIRLDSADGELLGECRVGGTGGWQEWRSVTAPIRPTSGLRSLCLVYRGAEPAWQESDTTVIWAQFPGVDPNQAEVEINVRQSVFYPSKPGVDYLTVRGFSLRHAATNWAPPTAEQVGLIGTHWSKGWIIEDNDIRYSTCTGVTLGKHGDEWDNTSANSAEGYVETIERGLANGWTREKVGGHVVRNNTIAHCEQAGVVGSLGAAFSTVSGNTIHDIHVRRLFTGAEMAGIKLHAAIDSEVSGNHIYRCVRGIWLDWMAQGTRVTRNLLHDNGPGEDLFLEVNHGPFLVANNVCLSPTSLLVNSQGGAYAHNLFAGQIHVIHTEGRLTPANQPHSTALDGLHPNPSGDDRYYNNLFAGGSGLAAYDPAELEMFVGGNVFLGTAQPSRHESAPLIDAGFAPGIELRERAGAWELSLSLDPSWSRAGPRPLVCTALLGRTAATGLPYELPDGAPLCVDADYFGRPRDQADPFPGPFEAPEGGGVTVRLWPPAQGARD